MSIQEICPTSPDLGLASDDMRPKLIPRVNILGVGISATNMAEAINTILSWTQQGERHYVCFSPVHAVMECQRDAELREIHNRSGMTVPDGMPLVWAGRLQGFTKINRVFGPELMFNLCRISVRQGFTHYLYGGDAGVADKLCQRLEEKFPGIRIVGTFTPPFRPLNKSEEKGLIEQVAKLKPDLFWVGLGCPKQERFMAEYLPKLDTKVMLGVGAAFDFHTGRALDAPDWIKRAGLQWLHRFIQDPKRLWKRNLIDSPTFVLKFFGQLIMNDSYSAKFLK
jgi:N-acetylglucosaminyldiphosphoundecaprenol N-acetyl-beta-D-mannosaminyltransferase